MSATPGHRRGVLHPANPYRDRPYDWPRLVAAHPPLEAFIRPHPRGGKTIPFNQSAAILALNQALLAADFGLRHWTMPPGHLCPAVPGRLDYLLHVADLAGPLSPDNPWRLLDLGTGASGIYALLAAAHWQAEVVATDCAEASLEHLGRWLPTSPSLAARITLRHQPNPAHLLEGVCLPQERFDACVCNPPFHDSLPHAEASAASRHPLRQETTRPEQSPFGGVARELVYPGGEVAFVQRLVRESQERPTLCRWFTCLISRQTHLAPLAQAVRDAGAKTWQVRPFYAGQKQAHFLAWSFA